ncbi:MAG TPA: hypothetical protein VFD29_10885 [Gillisia sp.]|nr:hypothetical protein [Gillisia sp.]
MGKKQNIADIFPKHLFWDVDMNKLDFKRDKYLIIPKALFATTEVTFVNDIEHLENFYSKTEILNTLKKTKELISNTVCELVAKRYHSEKFFRFSL